mgnify:FL=1|tara:strand:+ start:142 stop:558 length:417 start_codon:yes stop_codon:yes gene_type:complete
MSNVDTSKTYWDNEGKYQEQYNAAWKALIPMSGEAENGWPEALRAISRIGYDYYNNGFCNLWRSWDDGDTVMDSYYEDMVEYLRHHIPSDMFKQLNEFLHDAKGYGNWSNQAGVIDRIIDHIMEGIMEDGLLEEELVS